jgi:hypothetical protein
MARLSWRKWFGFEAQLSRRERVRHQARPRVEQLEGRLVPAVYTVNALTDTGAGAGLAGDLRYCITQSNSNAGPNTIQFNVPGSGVQTIAVGSTTGQPLPVITTPVTIDGRSEPSGLPLTS